MQMKLMDQYNGKWPISFVYVSKSLVTVITASEANHFAFQSQADRGDLESKVSLNQFDESFSLLDRGLSDALEKMDNQMSVEDALKETLLELQSKLHLKMDRYELESLREQLESRMREVQVTRATAREKPAEDGEPAGFRR
mgnify:FL=1